MFNKSYQLRAVREAGGGHQLASKSLLRLPEAWRPLVTVAALRDELFYRPEQRIRPGKSGKNRNRLQLELFPENPGKERCCSGPCCSGPPKVFRDPERPLFDLFPEAYE
jgi:hypothetical protein